MKKILFLSFLIIFAFAAELTQTQIYHLVQEYLHLNIQLQELNAQSENNTSLLSKEKNTIKKDKEKILNALPKLISSEEINKELMQNFTIQSQILEKELKRLKKDSLQYKNKETALNSLLIDELFYASFLELHELFKQTASSEQMQTHINTYITALDEGFDELSFSDENAKKDLEFKKNSYKEVLNYLSQKAYLFESNYIFSELRLQNVIDYINDFTQIQWIDTGKLVISVLVLILFYVLRVFLPPLILFCMMKVFFKNSSTAMDKAEVRELFITKNQKPFSLLLFFYAFSVCFAVFYYPAPVNITVNNIFYVIYVALFAWLIVGLLNSYGIMLVSKLAQRSGKKEVANLIIKILYFVIIIIATLLVLAHLGFNVSAIIASLGIGGLAVALAAKDIIANFFASLIISFDDSFNQGDWIQVAGIEGNVVETGLRKTTLRTFDNSLVFLPNSTIMNANIQNWSKRKLGRHIKMNLGVSYDAKPEQLEQCVKDLKEYLDKSPLVAHTDDSALNHHYSAKYRQNLVSVNDLEGYKNACYVALKEFADSCINIELYFYTKTIKSGEFRQARQDLMLDFMRILEKNGLGFAFPSLSIYVENLKDLNKKS